MTFLKKHFDAIFNRGISGSGGLWKVIYLILLSPNFEKVKPYFPRKGICRSFLWNKWLKFRAKEGEFLFEKLVKIVAFFRRPLNREVSCFVKSLTAV